MDFLSDYLADSSDLAVGITATQLGLGPILECLAGCLLAGAGVLTGVAYARLAMQSGKPRRGEHPAWPALDERRQTELI